HRHALALEVGERLDAGFRAGDDLDVVRVDGGDPAQLVQRRLEADFGVALPGSREGVAESEGDLAAPGLDEVQVFDRSLGRLDRGFHLGNGLAIDLGQGNAERVVDPAGAPGQDVDE